MSNTTGSEQWVLRGAHGEYTIAGEGCVVGRGSSADLALNDESVSRRHARFHVLASSATVQDLESHNGTFVNGIPVVGCTRLSAGDQVALGTCVLQLVRVRARSRSEEPTRTLSRKQVLGSGGSLSSLSGRERVVLPMLARGMSAREIAEELGVGVKTIETYRARIRQKLGLSTRAQIVRFALDAGVLRQAFDQPT